MFAVVSVLVVAAMTGVLMDLRTTLHADGGISIGRLDTQSSAAQTSDEHSG